MHLGSWCPRGQGFCRSHAKPRLGELCYRQTSAPIRCMQSIRHQGIRCKNTVAQYLWLNRAHNSRLSPSSIAVTRADSVLREGRYIFCRALVGSSRFGRMMKPPYSRSPILKGFCMDNDTLEMPRYRHQLQVCGVC